MTEARHAVRRQVRRQAFQHVVDGQVARRADENTLVLRDELPDALYQRGCLACARRPVDESQLVRFMDRKADGVLLRVVQVGVEEIQCSCFLCGKWSEGWFAHAEQHLYEVGGRRG